MFLSSSDIFIYPKMALTHALKFYQANPTYMPVYRIDSLWEVYLPCITYDIMFCEVDSTMIDAKKTQGNYI